MVDGDGTGDFDCAEFVDASTTIREQNRRKLFLAMVGMPCRTLVRRSVRNDMFHRWEATTSSQGNPIFFRRDPGMFEYFYYFSKQ